MAAQAELGIDVKQNYRNSFLLALGSNASDDALNNEVILKAAVTHINQSGLTIERISGIWRTPAFPAGAGPDFANACALASGDLSAAQVLEVLHQIEAEMGRTREKRWGQRVIDLDLLAAGDLVLPDAVTQRHWQELPLEAQMRVAPEQLILPHPRLQDRAFVLLPLCEVAPDWRHPLLGQSVSEMCAALDPGEVAALRAMSAKP
ncbi:2-amino-4-hydroxy-6-hydroxymethyldihydropteridine diphosphokinase [Pararhodobacter oceanensis]|uniref:2-amino-4-hydroxy-6-hydroxymethyldihydropteridine pyrophosphokinase n=1 Tax=Pararhodobacter oceanensis TaxID=2172121 RepID=A0A2T8HQM7_9RHOB|nr:2-amino-4-hydroxy-6-hydroxymethyldihydropteridine diphosphokinase [Pararhodobacter oceanensis]PVH27751.1 2-amino-4-hydroxy-6-hydroxymethyldihydropteridine diphosphokinase [Pararhodobacter oceanensis]